MTGGISSHCIVGIPPAVSLPRLSQAARGLRASQLYQASHGKVSRKGRCEIANYPVSLDSLANPTPTTLRNAPGFSLSAQVSTLNDIAEALEAKLGIGASVPGATAGVLRRTAAGSSAWGQVASGDLDPSFVLPAGTGLRKLVDTTLGASSATVDFPNVSQSYTSLVIVCAASSSAASNNLLFRLSFDGTTFDATANYDSIYTNQTSTPATSGGVIVTDTAWTIGGMSNFNSFPPCIVEVPLYTVVGFYKGYHARALNVSAFSAAGYTMSTVSGQHRASTAAIKGLRLALTSGTFVAGSRFILFGVPGTLG